MSDMTISPDTKTDAEYMVEFEEIMAEIRQYEQAFDRTQAEIEAMQAIAERKAPRRAARRAEINRMMQKLGGAN